MRMYRRGATYRQLALLLAIVMLAAPLSGCFAAGDNDHDGVLDVDDPDDDNDGMPDEWENQYALNPWDGHDASADADHDGLLNLAEFHNGTNPRAPDSDGDGMPDGFEVANGLNPMDGRDAGGDADGDGLSNVDEFKAGTSASKADTDDDQIPDGWEAAHGLNPTNPDDAVGDPDGDDFTNLLEYGASTDPHNPDTDGDGMADGWEAAYGLDPKNPSDASGNPDADSFDANFDGVISPDENYTNAREFAAHTNPTVGDTDGDGMIDGYEWACGLNGTDASDKWKDADHDGVSNFNESLAGSSSARPDTDNDTMPDGFEIAHGLNPINGSDAGGDPDADGLSNALEFARGGDPRVNDTDHDGVLDGVDADPAHDLGVRLTIRFVNVTFPAHPSETNFDPPWELSFSLTIGGVLLPPVNLTLDGSTNLTGEASGLSLTFFLNVDDGIQSVSLALSLAELDLPETVGVNADDVVDLDPTGNNETLSMVFDLVSHAISGEVTSGAADGAADGRNGEADARILFDVVVEFV